MKKFPMKKLLISAACLLAVYGAWSWIAGGSKSVATPSVLVSTVPVQKGDVPLALRNVGTVVANQTVAVRSRLDAQQIMEVKFRDGDYVNAGDLMFVLDDRPLKAQLAEQQANLEKDKANLENLRRQYERAKVLEAKKYEAAADLDTAKAAYAAASATVDADASLVDNLKVQLEYTRITAPISGRTGTIAVTAGNTVKANDVPLVTINQVKPIRVQVSLPQHYLDAVRSAMKAGKVDVTAMHEGGGEAVRGTLEYIDNNVDQSTATFAARAIFPNDDEKLWPGMFVTLVLTLGTEKNVLTVPEVALQHGQNGDYVFVIAGGKAVKRDVKVARIEQSRAVIEQGLHEGEQVAVDGLMSLKNDADVTVQNKEPKAKP